MRSVERSGRQTTVAVPLVPVGELEAREHRHVHVDRQEVVARLDPVREDVIDEEVTGDALADQSTLVVGKDDENGVHLVVADHPLEFGRLEHPAHAAHHMAPLIGRACSSAVTRGSRTPR